MSQFPQPLPKPLFKTTPFKFTLVFSLLLMIAAMLAIVMIYSQSYTAAERATKQRLVREMAWLSSPSAANYSLSYLPKEIKTVPLSYPLPAGVSPAWTQHPSSISASTIAALGWQKYGVYERSWVAVVPRNGGYLAILLPMQSIRLLPLIEVLVYLFFVIIAIMWSYAALINRRTMRRIEQIDETAKYILQGNMSKRIARGTHQHDEYSPLIETLNEMLDRMQQLMRDLRQVNQNIAHDLKTPLNRLRSRLEVALLQREKKIDFLGVIADSIEDIDTLLVTFNALLLMGNLDAKSSKYPLKVIPLADLLHNVAALYEAIALEKHHDWQVDIEPSVNVFAHQDLLSQAISNLLDNAIKYTPKSGKISLSLHRQGTFAVVSIADNGPGIAAADQTKVFEPFSRLDASRQLPGNGLGMSLVRSILTVHNARIELLDNQPGLRVNVYLRVVE